MEDMKTERIVFTTNFVSDSAMKTAGSKKLQPGSVIASCVGNFGIASINDVEVVINQQLQAFIPHDIEAEYLRLQVTISKAYFEIVGTSATLVYVNQEGFANLPVIVPPQQEQKEIVASITLRSDKFSHLIKRVEQAIDLMQERRTTLISAAVTGKIDVRNWQPAQTEIPREVRS
jgi:type I restriction enzyme S subunit